MSRRLFLQIGAVCVLVVALIVLGVMLLKQNSHSKDNDASTASSTTSATLDTEGPLPIGSFNSCGAGKRVALTFDDGEEVQPG